MKLNVNDEIDFQRRYYQYGVNPAWRMLNDLAETKIFSTDLEKEGDNSLIYSLCGMAWLATFDQRPEED